MPGSWMKINICFLFQCHRHPLFLGLCIYPASLPLSPLLPRAGSWGGGAHPSGWPGPLSVGDLTSSVLSPVSSQGSSELHTRDPAAPPHLHLKHLKPSMSLHFLLLPLKLLLSAEWKLHYSSWSP